MMQTDNDMVEIPEGSSGSLDEQAEEWLVYLYSGAASEEGRRRFSEWLRASDAHASAYQGAEQFWRDLGFTRGTRETLSNTGLSPVPQASGRKFGGYGSSSLYAAAAALLLVVTGAVAWINLASDSTSSVRYASGVGEIKTIDLADGSIATLSPGTSLTASFSKRARHIDLTQGGVYLVVGADPSRPFTLAAGRTRITDIGTEFDVLKSARGVRVAVANGVVDVRQWTDGSAAGQVAQLRRLVAGELVVADPDGRLGAVQKFDKDQVLSWLQGRLVYVDMPLEYVIEDVNRYRRKKILVYDKSLRESRVTASMRIDQTDQLLTGIKSILPASIHEDASAVTIGLSAETDRR